MLQQLNLRKIRRNAQKKLANDYKMLFGNMTNYIKHSALSGYETEIVLNEILDILLESQESGQAISEINRIIGDDYEMFCQSIINEYISGKSKVYRAMKYFSRGFAITLVLILIFGALNGITQLKPMLFLDVRDIVFACAWGFVFLPYALKRFRRMPNIYNKDDMKILLLTITIILAMNEAIKFALGSSFLDKSIGFIEGFPFLLATACMIAIFEAGEIVYELKLHKN
jgi:DNA-binding ferritin-like protein (Dps family)